MSSLQKIDSNTQDSPFESIRRIDEQNNEFWMARDLMPLLGYPRWNDFKEAVSRAQKSCANTGNVVTEHFSGLCLKNPSSKQGRNYQDFKLSRFACYLTAMNGDPGKPEIASAQAYFAIKTREAETKIPKTFAEALQLAANQARELEEQQILINSLEQENTQLSEAVDELFDYSSIIRVAKFNKCSENKFHWRKLKTASTQLGVEIKQVPCPRFGTKNLYAHDAWRLAYPGVQLPETLTIVVSSQKSA